MKITYSAKVSVIVPVYNGEYYLSECLDSIVNQTLKDIEIICIDDGSIDNSSVLLDYYLQQDPRIKVYKQTNKGLSAARNVGVYHSTGKYIGFVDSDDLIDVDFYEKLFNIAEEYQADISMGNCRIFNSINKNMNDLSWIQKCINNLKADIIYDISDRKLIIESASVCNKLYLKTFIDFNNISFFEGLYWEDNPYSVMTTIKANKICIVRDVFYNYRRHSKSITTIAAFDRKPFDFFVIMDKLSFYFEKEKLQLTNDYKYYFDELQVRYYYISLLNRVHKSFRKEFFNEVQIRIRRIDNESTAYIMKVVPWFCMFKYCNYRAFEMCRTIIKCMQFVINYIKHLNVNINIAVHKLINSILPKDLSK